MSYKQRVIGSSPVIPTYGCNSYGNLRLLDETRGCTPQGFGFNHLEESICNNVEAYAKLLSEYNGYGVDGGNGGHGRLWFR